MSRTLSTAATQGVMAQETAEIYLVILAISHAAISTLYVVQNTVDVVSNGNTYIAYPFDLTLPPDSDQGLIMANLTIDNVDRQIVAALRLITSPPSVAVSVILASSLDTVEAGPYNMLVESAEYDDLTVRFKLAFEDVLNEPFPAPRFDPPSYPGMF